MADRRDRKHADGDRSVDRHITALKDTHRRVRQAAASALGTIGDASAVPALVEALKDGKSSVRMAAASALGRIGDVRAVPALIHALNDQWIDVRMAAASALGEIGDVLAVPALMRALKDLRPPVREHAALALGAVGVPAVPALIEAMNDEALYVREAAMSALQGIGDVETVPRKIVSDSRVPAPERVKVFDFLRSVLDYPFADIRSVCDEVIRQGSVETRAATDAVLNCLDADRHPVPPSWADSAIDREILLRLWKASLPQSTPAPSSAVR